MVTEMQITTKYEELYTIMPVVAVRTHHHHAQPPDIKKKATSVPEANLTLYVNCN